MATIPKLQRQVSPQALPDVKLANVVTPDSMGAGVYKGLGQLSQGIQTYQQKQDTADAISAMNEIKSRTTDLLYNKDTGLMYKQGSQAKGLESTFNTEFDKQYNDIKGQLTPRQQALFNQNVTTYRSQLQPHITEHEIKQADIALQDSLKTATYNTSNLLNQPDVWRNPALVDSSLSDLEQATRAANPSKDPETIKRMISTTKDQVLKASLNTLYEQQDIEGAKEFIKLHGKKMSAGTIAPYQGWIEKKEERFKAQNIADSLFSQYSLDNERGAMKALKDQYGNTPLFEKASSVLQSKYVDERRFKKEDDEKHENEVISQIFAASSQADAQDILANSNLKPKTRLWLENSYIKPKFKALASKPTPEQKWASKYESSTSGSGFISDTLIMQQYLQDTSGPDPKEYTPAQQYRANMASIRLNRYRAFHGGGGYEGQQEPSGMGELKQSDDTNSEPQQDSIDKWIDKARNSGADPEWIKQKLAEKGYDQHVSHVW